MNLLEDIYFKKAYAALYLKANESLFEFEHRNGDFVFVVLAIKRPITQIGKTEINDGYFDLETAYGYGGIYCNTDDKVFLEESTQRYHQACIDAKIIADFSRIHPYNDTPSHLTDFYDLFINDRPTVSVDTTLSKSERWNTYPSKIRTILRKCEKELTFRATDDIDTFMKLYESTMQKNDADDYYYFDRQYFENLLKLDGVKLYEVLYDQQVISASFFMFGKAIGHYHLSANDYAFRKHNANYFILDSIFDVAHEHQIQAFHLGGGRTNKPDDTLLRFKEKFSNTKKNFYIAGKVHNPSVYNKYIDMWEDQNPNSPSFFLKYRLA